jgi:hypothetical protein
MATLRQRMYILVPYNLSSIQKSIQALHAVVRYQLKYGRSKEYKQWATKDETVIILDGGTSNKKTGSLDNLLKDLKNRDYNVEAFYEPDANDMLTGVAILADERIWDQDNYPNFVNENKEVYNYKTTKEYLSWVKDIGGEKIVYLRDVLNYKKLAN